MKSRICPGTLYSYGPRCTSGGAAKFPCARGGVGAAAHSSWKKRSSVPVAVTGALSLTVIATGGYHTCAAMRDGHVRCWGSNVSGALGDGDWATQSGPVPITW